MTHSDEIEAILQQLRTAWRQTRACMVEAKTAKARATYAHGCNAFVNAIGVVLNKGDVTWAYHDGEAWLKKQGEAPPWQ